MMSMQEIETWLCECTLRGCREYRAVDCVKCRSLIHICPMTEGPFDGTDCLISDITCSHADQAVAMCSAEGVIALARHLSTLREQRPA